MSKLDVGERSHQTHVDVPSADCGWRDRCVVGARLALGGLALLVAAPLSAARADIDGVEIVNGLLRADVMWASTAPYAGVFLWPDNDSLSQEFDLLDSGEGWFRIRARHSGQCLMLDFLSGAFENGTRIVQHPYCDAGYTASEWRIVLLSGTICANGLCTTGYDRMLLMNRATGKCLDAPGEPGIRPSVMAVLQQWDCVSASSALNIGSQTWDILRTGPLPGWLPTL